MCDVELIGLTCSIISFGRENHCKAAEHQTRHDQIADNGTTRITTDCKEQPGVLTKTLYCLLVLVLNWQMSPKLPLTLRLEHPNLRIAPRLIELKYLLRDLHTLNKVLEVHSRDWEVRDDSPRYRHTKTLENQVNPKTCIEGPQFHINIGSVLFLMFSSVLVE